MMRYLFTALGILLSLTSLNSRAADTWTNPSSSVVSLFACELNPGKTQDDVWQVMVRNTKAQRSIRSYNSKSFLWLPMRGRTGFDYIFGFIGQDLTDSVANLEAYMAGPGPKMGPEFGALGECTSGIYESTRVRPGKVNTGDDRKLDAIVELFSCKAKEGTTQRTMDAAVELWNQGVNTVRSKVMREQYDAVVSRPMWGGIEDHDYFWAGNFPSLSGLAESAQAMMDSPAAQKGLGALGALSDCESSLWTAYWLNGPKG